MPNKETAIAGEVREKEKANSDQEENPDCAPGEEGAPKDEKGSDSPAEDNSTEILGETDAPKTSETAEEQPDKRPCWMNLLHAAQDVIDHYKLKSGRNNQEAMENWKEKFEELKMILEKNIWTRRGEFIPPEYRSEVIQIIAQAIDLVDFDQSKEWREFILPHLNYYKVTGLIKPVLTFRPGHEILREAILDLQKAFAAYRLDMDTDGETGKKFLETLVNLHYQVEVRKDDEIPEEKFWEILGSLSLNLCIIYDNDYRGLWPETFTDFVVSQAKEKENGLRTLKDSLEKVEWTLESTLDPNIGKIQYRVANLKSSLFRDLIKSIVQKLETTSCKCPWCQFSKQLISASRTVAPTSP